MSIEVNYKCIKKTKLSYLRYNKDEFHKRLICSGITEFSDINDVNIIAEKFTNVLIKNCETMTVQKEIYDINCNWYNNHLKKLKNVKMMKYNRAVLLNTEYDWEQYRVSRNIYKAQLKKSKDEFIKNKIRNAKNQKELWKSIKQYVLNENRNSINEVKFGNEYMSQDEDIANKFNEFFVDSVTEINNSIIKIPYRNNIQQVELSFDFKPIEYNDLKKIIESISKKRDFNMINVRILVDCMPLIAPVLLKIINGSFSTGVFPNTWKQTLVVPVQKVKNTKNCEEFRPINMMETQVKILEKAAQMQLEKYFEENDLLADCQSGFRRNHSCEAAVNLVVTKWKEDMDKKLVTVAVFVDLKRAFETIDRSILLEKLYRYGVKGNAHKWFASYLKDRTQKTRVNKAVSIPKIVGNGVPQGGILSALVFLVYINDMVNIIVNSNVMQFADDTLIYITRESVKDCIDEIQNDLNNLSEWLKMNKLKLNVSKTKAICINGNCSESLYIDGEIVEFVEEIKYLGLTIDNMLNFNKHTNYLCKKISKKIGFFNRIRNRINLSNSIMLYNAMIRPHFEYCSSILFLSNEMTMNRMQRLQNRAMRSILKCSRYTSVKLMLDTLKWLSIKQRIFFNVLVFVFKMKYNLMPHYLCRQLKYVGDAQPYHLRNKNDFRLNRYRTNRVQKTIMYKGLQLFNRLPQELKSEVNLIAFKRGIVQYVKRNVN